MPRRYPNVMVRACEALNLTPASLAKHIGISTRHITSCIASGAAADTSFDDTWPRVAALLDERVAVIMAVRQELQAKLAKDRNERLMRREAIAKRG